VNEAKLAEARTTLSTIKNNDLLATTLEGYAVSLPAHDAVTLFREYIPRLVDKKKIDLASLGGTLALMLGRYDDGAYIFRQIAQENPESGLKAARAYLAAGDIEEAKVVLELLQEQPGEPLFQENKSILRAWLYLFEGKGESAFVILRDMGFSAQGLDKNKALGRSPSPLPEEDSVEKEALFMFWILASTYDIGTFSKPSTGYEVSALEALLKSRYPQSFETAMIQRGIMPTPGAWLLSGVFPFRELGIESSVSLSQPGAGAGTPGQAVSTPKDSFGESSSKLQVGWFSKKDNANNLGASLRKSGFTVSVEEQRAQDGQARWAVIVNAEKDWTTTQAKLKDLGYESYLLP
jgi:hypothetical protein